MADELGLSELIDTVVKQDHAQRRVSVGMAVKAMILNGLGLINRAMYLMPHFFKDKPVERLLGAGIEAEHLNDDTLGRVLDAVYAYGPEELYGQLAAQAVKRLGLSCEVGHLDATRFHQTPVIEPVAFVGARPGSVGKTVGNREVVQGLSTRPWPWPALKGASTGP